jgi:predicted ester cyclase
MTPSPPKHSRPGRSTNPLAIVHAYIGRINAHDPEGLGNLATERTRFVDATGGRHALRREAWAAYFADFPDYRIDVERMFAHGPTVAVFGTASGSYRGRGRSAPEAAWRFPAAWSATVRSGKVVEWRVYGDIEPMLKSAGVGRS